MAEGSPLSVADLKKQKEALDQQLAERIREEKRDVLRQIKEAAQDYEISLDEIIAFFGGRQTGVKAPIKYRDPVTGKGWSGRGKEPAWIKGKDRTPFEVLPEVVEG